MQGAFGEPPRERQLIAALGPDVQGALIVCQSGRPHEQARIGIQRLGIQVSKPTPPTGRPEGKELGPLEDARPVRGGPSQHRRRRKVRPDARRVVDVHVRAEQLSLHPAPDLPPKHGRPGKLRLHARPVHQGPQDVAASCRKGGGRPCEVGIVRRIDHPRSPESLIRGPVIVRQIRNSGGRAMVTCRDGPSSRRSGDDLRDPAFAQQPFELVLRRVNLQVHDVPAGFQDDLLRQGRQTLSR